MALMKAHERLADYWKRTAQADRSGASEKAISAAEVALRMRLPEDFREYLSAAGDCDSYVVMDDNYFAFWTLDTIVREITNPMNGSRPGATGRSLPSFGFADFLIHSHSYELSTDPESLGSILIRHSDTHTVRIAGSFTEFIDLYITDAPGLYG